MKQTETTEKCTHNCSDAIQNYKECVKSIIPYGKQTLDQTDIDAINSVLLADTFLTTGPKVREFEEKIEEYCGVKHALAVNSGTAALHLAVAVLNLKMGDEVIVPAISFVATSNAVLYCGGKPVFCDVGKDLNIDPDKVESLITIKTRAIIAVDYAGQPCNYDQLSEISMRYNLVLIGDGAHSIGSVYKGVKVGALCDLTTLSFHPVKNMTTCEGGMITTNNSEYYQTMKGLRSHGIAQDFRERLLSNSHKYDMKFLGFNYRIPDILCSLGITQLAKLDEFKTRRQLLVNIYNDRFKEYSHLLEPVNLDKDACHHIYVIKLKLENLQLTRDELYKKLSYIGIKTNVHYLPIYLHTYYQNLGYNRGLCPNAEELYERILTLPLFPNLTEIQLDYICENVIKILQNAESFSVSE